MVENFEILYKVLGQEVKIFFEHNDLEEYWFCKKGDKVWLRDKSLEHLKEKIKNSVKNQK